MARQRKFIAMRYTYYRRGKPAYVDEVIPTRWKCFCDIEKGVVQQSVYKHKRVGSTLQLFMKNRLGRIIHRISYWWKKVQRPEV